MATPLWVCGRPRLSDGRVSLIISGSNQTVREPLRLSALVLADQFAVLLVGESGLLTVHGYRIISKGLISWNLCNGTLPGATVKMLCRVILSFSRPVVLEISTCLFLGSMTTVSGIIFLYGSLTRGASVAAFHLDEMGHSAAAAAVGMLIVYAGMIVRVLHRGVGAWLIRRSQAGRVRWDGGAVSVVWTAMLSDGVGPWHRHDPAVAFAGMHTCRRAGACLVPRSGCGSGGIETVGGGRSRLPCRAIRSVRHGGAGRRGCRQLPREGVVPSADQGHVAPWTSVP